MTDVAVVKPDHLGDFVLSVPALRALQQKFGNYDLYAAPGNRFLLEHFLPEGPALHPTKLAHLQKDGIGEGMPELIAQLKPYSLIVFLRDDGFCHEAASILGTRAVVPRSDNVNHETRIQQCVTEPLTGKYSRSSLMWPAAGSAPQWPSALRTVGISLSAGFFANKIPATTWMRLAQSLQSKLGIAIKLIGGPLEADELRMLARMLNLADSDVILGGAKLSDFHARVGECDVVVGADSGTLHLVSVCRPVLGVFTSSPWQRFSPFGASNRVLYSDVPCSPCIQFSKDAYNGCVIRECAALITAPDIEAALLASGPGAKPKLGRLLHFVCGPSHI
ncbi:glycosyltransferase family 9 protein [Burkholderia ubonensis]|uniref:glycosyltransferase family 9 protein n=1 Tax=Burkholderia ubonensis TaxID=101571 RepID=UPI0009B4133B|nr:glycosyltransferase family 9 protein [Burkholderia ubonensis]